MYYTSKFVISKYRASVIITLTIIKECRKIIIKRMIKKNISILISLIIIIS